MADRERAVWRGEVVTVLDRGVRSVEIRDGFGRTHSVRRGEVKPLREDDERRKFRAPEVKE